MRARPDSRLIAVNVYLNLPTFHLPPPEHAGGIETPRKLAVGSNRDHASIAVNGRKLFMDHLIGGLLQREALQLNQRADLARDRVANKEFTHASA